MLWTISRDARPAREAIDEEDGVRGEKDDEDGRQNGDGFLDAADVENDHNEYQDGGHPYFVGLPFDREVTEESVRARDDGDDYRQYVVDDEGASRYDAGPLAEHLRRDDVAAAAVGEALDDLRIGIGDDKDSEGRGQAEEYGHIGVSPEIAEGFFRSVGRGRESVGPEPYPREKRNQGDLVENMGIADVAGPTEYFEPDALRETRFAGILFSAHLTSGSSRQFYSE